MRPPLPVKAKVRRTIAANFYNSAKESSPSRGPNQPANNNLVVIPGYGTYVHSKQTDQNTTLNTQAQSPRRSSVPTHNNNIRPHYETVHEDLTAPSAEDYFEAPLKEMDQFDRKVSKSAIQNAVHANKYPRIELQKLKAHEGGKIKKEQAKA
jgi:hypothetical protein